ncbi:MAG: hypothetical protein QM723_33895 [Myxococcaceae bacterium]
MNLLLSLLLSTAPMADVWPYQAKHLPDGRIEYSYDLTLLKQKPPPVETVANQGEKQTKEFLAGLPREVKVTVKPGAQVELRGGRPLEPKPLVPAFSQVSDAPYSSSDPLGRTPKNRLRPALAPEEPKVLVTAEAVLWRVRRFEDGALGALLLDSDAISQQLWSKVIEKAQVKRRNSGGDAAEGAMLLVARILIAQAQGDGAKIPKAQLTDGALAQVAEQELKALGDKQDSVMPWRFEGWTPELKAAAVRTHLFGVPLPTSRPGAAAGLVFLGAVQDPKLEPLWTKLRARRDASIAPVDEPLLRWKELSQGKTDASLEDLAGFLDSLGNFSGQPLLARATTPARKFLTELEGQARVAAVDELVAAAGDGRLTGEHDAKSSIAELSDWALAGLPAVEEAKGLSVDASWRARRSSAFAAVLGLHRDSSDDGSDLPEPDEDRSDLHVRLMVPPDLVAEPSPVTYSREVISLDRIAAVFQQQGICNLHAITPDGSRSPDTICNEAKSWGQIMRGLSHLVDLGGDPKDLAAAKRFADTWRQDSALRSDVREANALPIAAGSKRLHSAVIGVGRRELAVQWGAPPELVEELKDSFIVAPAEQRYLVPQLVTKGTWADAKAPPVERAKLKALCDAANGDPGEIEGAFSSAVK